MAGEVGERRIPEALHRVPEERWGEVLTFLRSLEPGEPAGVRSLTAEDLLRSGLVGLWADRPEIGEGHEFARRLRQQAQTRNFDG